MTSKDRITKAKISLLINEPWFGQLACYLNLQERKKGFPTAAINERGDFFFNPEFIKRLTDLELKGLVCHEILHLAFQHPFRVQHRNPVLWNIAADLKVNAELTNRSDLKLPQGGLIPDAYSHEWEYAKVKIKNIDKKTTEQIYAELYNKVPKFKISISFGKGGGVKVNTSQLPKPWKDLVDRLVKDLLKSKGKPGDKVTPKDLPGLSREWKARIDSANQTMKGDVPAGLAREMAALEHPELPWHRIITQRFSRLETEKTWRRPSKRWLPYYFPGTQKNKSLRAVIALDTSGSMSKEDITKAISETWGIATAFRKFKLYIIANDAKVWDVIEVTNGNRELIKRLSPRGGGGTDFRPVFNLIKKRFKNQIDCLVFFTDGYGDFPSKKPVSYQVYWVTQSDDVRWPFGKVIRIKSQ